MKNWKIALYGATCFMLGSALTVSAGTWIDAYKNDEIKVTLDGKVQEFRDETTNAVQYPLTYEGRTYLPLRTVANLTGLNVEYDENSKTAILQTKKEDTEAMIAIKKALKDKEWVKANVMMKKNCFGDSISNNQKLTFAKLNDDMVIVEAYAYGVDDNSSEYTDFGDQLFLVGYKDGEVKVHAFHEEGPNHPGHSGFGVNITKGMIGEFYMHMGTSINILKDELYDLIATESIGSSFRQMLAGRLASSAEEWTKIFARENSGTCNEQAIILDMNKIDFKNKKIEDKALMIIEQMPNKTETKDVTEYLRKGHWPSYNVPFIDTIYKDLGYYVNETSEGVYENVEYTQSERALIFKRDQGNINSKEEFKKERYNDYVSIQEGWMNFNYQLLRDKLTDELYNQYEMQLETLKTKNQKRT